MMKTIKLLLISVLFTIAAAGAFASKKLVLHEYLYFPNGEQNDPVTVQVDIHCLEFDGWCEAVIQGVSYQLFRIDPLTGMVRPAKMHH